MYTLHIQVFEKEGSTKSPAMGLAISYNNPSCSAELGIEKIVFKI